MVSEYTSLSPELMYTICQPVLIVSTSDKKYIQIWCALQGTYLLSKLDCTVYYVTAEIVPYTLTLNSL